MIFIKRGTLIRPKQIRLDELITVERVLASRGFEVTSEGQGADTLLPRDIWEGHEADLVYDVFADQELRSELLSFIINQEKPNFDKVNQLINISDFTGKRQSFSVVYQFEIW